MIHTHLHMMIKVKEALVELELLVAVTLYIPASFRLVIGI